VRFAFLVVVSRQLKEAEPLTLDQLRGGALLTPDLAKAQQAFEARTDRDHEAGDDGSDREDPGLGALDVQLAQADERGNQRAGDHYRAAQCKIPAPGICRARVPPQHVVQPACLQVFVLLLVLEVEPVDEYSQLFFVDQDCFFALLAHGNFFTLPARCTVLRNSRFRLEL
jgi:hypothetical protein